MGIGLLVKGAKLAGKIGIAGGIAGGIGKAIKGIKGRFGKRGRAGTGRRSRGSLTKSLNRLMRAKINAKIQSQKIKLINMVK